MFASPPFDSHRLRNRGLLDSPLATHYRSTQEQSIITIHVSSAHAGKYVSSFLLFPEKGGNMKSVGFEPTTYILLDIWNYPLAHVVYVGQWVVRYNQQKFFSLISVVLEGI